MFRSTTLRLSMAHRFRLPDTALRTWQRPVFLCLALASLWARRSITTVVADGATAIGTAIGMAERVVYNRNVYYGNNAWRGGYYGSSATAYGPVRFYDGLPRLQFVNGNLRERRNRLDPIRHSKRRSSLQSVYRHLRAWRIGVRAQWKRIGWQRIQPVYGSLCPWCVGVRAYGSAAAGKAYNPSTGAYGATRQASNAYGTYGSSVASKNGQAAYTQHQTTAQGSVGTVQTTTGAKGAAATGANGNSGAVGQTANGNKYAASSNGNVYQNTGSGWQTNPGDPSPGDLPPQATREPTLLLLAAMEGSRGAAGHRPLAEAEAAGNTRQASARGSASRSGGGGTRSRR